jgi:hypothetical protein
MRLNIQKFLMILLFLPGLSGTIISQMNNWVMPPYRVDVTQTPVAWNPLYATAPTAVYNVSNGAYDQAGSLLFYVENFSIYSSSGAFVAQVGPNSSWVGVWGGEAVIVPVPGQCKKFYVIYSFNGDALYSIVDCSGSPIVVIKDTGGTGFPIGQFGYIGTGLAASKKTLDPNGPGFIYYLYMVNSGVVYYSIIDGLGISSATLLYSSSNIKDYLDNTTSPGIQSPRAATEVELSENGGYLAYNGVATGSSNYSISTSGKVEVLELPTPVTTGSTWLYNEYYAVMNGLEFMGSGSAPVLFVAGDKFATTSGPSTAGVLDIFDFLNNSTVSLYGTSVNDGKSTFLELSKAGQICYISEYAGDRYFVEYDISSNAFTSTQINSSIDLTPNGVSGSMLQVQYDYVYTLPDQIDGEFYDDFTTTPYSTIESAQINSVDIGDDANDCIPKEVYNCDPIILSFGYNISDPIFCEVSFNVH